MDANADAHGRRGSASGLGGPMGPTVGRTGRKCHVGRAGNGKHPDALGGGVTRADSSRVELNWVNWDRWGSDRNPTDNGRTGLEMEKGQRGQRRGDD